MPSMIQDLLNPRNLPDPTKKVDLVQTHISWVFMAESFVYKIKKPVNFGFLDFSTLTKRKHYCQKEIELNTRLCDDIYIGLLNVTYDGKRFRLEAHPSAEVMDYAVKMRRIPEGGLMKNLFREGKLTSLHMERLADVLADFHARTERSPEIDVFGRPERFKINTDENFAQVESYVGLSIDKSVLNTIKTWTETFYERRGEIFFQRITDGKVCDGHGDLHMEHICFEGGKISIFDCIEFNDRFRYADQVADISFLIMDLEFRGGRDYARTLWQRYKQSAREGDVEDLLTFYKVYRAFVRGKVNSFQLDDPNMGAREKEEALRLAKEYFALALRYIKESGTRG
ncbi:MAG: gluconokinase [Deltaproteobacteria bacterium]|nr:gluconokinase [Deltaproteobacteria bacterium]MBW1930531.1 gluconokinase [Deltaproteobacteria bacterium]MBW2025923.1 gluconokinase [Deltaproteobacteria bacterium]MBW2125705.1 gluconokinase [Deltaproteobacteria bacterium]RLB19902.1 MAG: gluconokinase [Deltaproteobacteria bacterium]